MEASKLIDQKIASLDDWRGKRMREVRKAILSVDPEIVEEWKWMGTPVWNRDGILCICNAHKTAVKVTFIKGAKLKDPQRVFNAELEGNAWRAINWSEGDPINVEGFKGLIREAIAINREKPSTRKAGGKSSVTAKTPSAKKAASKKTAVKKAAVKKAPAKTAPVKKAAKKRAVAKRK